MHRSTMPQAAVRPVALALAGAVLALAGGCGGARTTGAGSTSQPAPARTPAASAPAPAPAPAGAPAAPPGSATARAFSGKAGAARFRVLVGDICLAVRTGAPGPLGSGATDAAIRTHAVAGAQAARRTLTAFDRIRAPTTALAHLRPVSAGYQKLTSLYASVLGAGAPGPRAFRAALIREEQRTAAAAFTAGFAACAPATAGTRPR
jgi:hypothetical protein